MILPLISGQMKFRESCSRRTKRRCELTVSVLPFLRPSSSTHRHPCVFEAHCIPKPSSSPDPSAALAALLNRPPPYSHPSPSGSSPTSSSTFPVRTSQPPSVCPSTCKLSASGSSPSRSNSIKRLHRRLLPPRLPPPHWLHYLPRTRRGSTKSLDSYQGPVDFQPQARSAALHSPKVAQKTSVRADPSRNP